MLSGVAGVRERDEFVFQRVNGIEQIATLVVGQMAGHREFDAGEVHSVNLKAEAIQFVGGGRGRVHGGCCWSYI